MSSLSFRGDRGLDGQEQGEGTTIGGVTGSIGTGSEKGSSSNVKRRVMRNGPGGFLFPIPSGSDGALQRLRRLRQASYRSV